MICALLVATSAGRAIGASIEVLGSPGIDGIDGAAGNPGGDGTGGTAGGDAVALATSSESFNEAVAIGGDGGKGGNGGAGGAGGGAEADAFANGSTPTAIARAIGGYPGAGGAGGTASAGGSPGSSGTSIGGGAIRAFANAYANFGDATVSAEGVDHSGAAVDVTGEADAGYPGGSNPNGGAAILQSVQGISTAGGSVRVNGIAVGGSGGVGASVDVTDQVHGETSGALSLSQSAQGGKGSEQAGSGVSRLHRSGSFESLTVSAGGAGGDAVGTAAPGEAPADHADGIGEAEAVNDAGSATASASGYGGRSFGGGAGDGVAHATATSSGDGHSASAIASTNGGWVGIYNGTDIGHGGDAQSVSTSIALGNGDAYASSHSVGGRGVTAVPGEVAAGDAFSEASATSSGELSTVSAESYAAGGDSFLQFAQVPNLHGAGHARAIVTAAGFGVMSAKATSVGSGQSTAESSARSSGPVVEADAAIASDPGLSSSYLTAIAGSRQPMGAVELDALLRGTGGVLTYVNSQTGGGGWLLGNPTVSALQSPTRSPVAAGFVRSVAGTNHWTSKTTFALDRAALRFGDGLELGFLDPNVPAVGFDLLELHISADGHSIADLSFADAASAFTALDDSVVEIDPSLLGSDPISTIVLSISLQTTGAADAFYSNFVLMAGAVLPEPAQSLLVLLSLGAALLRRRAIP